MTDDEPSGGTCTAPEHRQFDFWIGDWDVHDPEGTPVGRNRITALFEGCALREEWSGASGHRGTSLNAWSASRGSWHQTWVDSSGLVLLLDGSLRDGAMILEGTAPSPDGSGAGVRHRISWTVMDGNPDRVRQHWQVAAEDGTWQTAFDGRYVRRATPATG
ncbi:MAG: hypothetical protein ACRDHD_01120 [Candidatus Limnocylindria bacterium]